MPADPPSHPTLALVSFRVQMWFATVEDGLVGAYGGPADKDQHPPSCDGGGDEGGKKHKNKGFLLETFGGWHAPVGSLLRATAEGFITREDARAMSRRGLRDIAAAAEAARRRSRGGGGGGGVVLVGDAAHTVSVSHVHPVAEAVSLSCLTA